MSAVSLLVEKISAHFGQLCTRSAQNGYFSNSTTNPRVLGGPNLPRFGGHHSASSLVLFGSALLMGGCAKNASDIQATYVSPMLYENWSCRFRMIYVASMRIDTCLRHTAGDDVLLGTHGKKDMSQLRRGDQAVLRRKGGLRRRYRAVEV